MSKINSLFYMGNQMNAAFTPLKQSTHISLIDTRQLVFHLTIQTYTFHLYQPFMVVDTIGGTALGCCPGTGLGFPVGVSKI